MTLGPIEIFRAPERLSGVEMEDGLDQVHRLESDVANKSLESSKVLLICEIALTRSDEELSSSQEAEIVNKAPDRL